MLVPSNFTAPKTAVVACGNCADGMMPSVILLAFNAVSPLPMPVKLYPVTAPVAFRVVKLPVDAVVAPIGVLLIDPPVIALPLTGMLVSVPLVILLALSAVRFVPTPLKLA